MIQDASAKTRRPACTKAGRETTQAGGSNALCVSNISKHFRLSRVLQDAVATATFRHAATTRFAMSRQPSLLDLPPELRLLIYDHPIGPTGRIYISSRSAEHESRFIVSSVGKVAAMVYYPFAARSGTNTSRYTSKILWKARRKSSFPLRTSTSNQSDAFSQSTKANGSLQ